MLKNSGHRIGGPVHSVPATVTVKVIGESPDVKITIRGEGKPGVF